MVCGGPEKRKEAANVLGDSGHGRELVLEHPRFNVVQVPLILVLCSTKVLSLDSDSGIVASPGRQGWAARPLLWKRRCADPVALARTARVLTCQAVLCRPTAGAERLRQKRFEVLGGSGMCLARRLIAVGGYFRAGTEAIELGPMKEGKSINTSEEE